MSVLENGNLSKGISEEVTKQVLSAVDAHPDLIKDTGLRQEYIHGTINDYRRVLKEARVTPEDIDTNANNVAQRLASQPRREVIVFSKSIHKLASHTRGFEEEIV